jgi:transcriptional regulator with XRE-family HTH domain
MPAPQTFHQMLLQARVNANQTVDAMAVLLNMSPEDYEHLESGKYPDDETLRRLCKLMGWNYYEAQRLIINEMISPHPKALPGTGAAPTKASPAPKDLPVGTPTPTHQVTGPGIPRRNDPLGSRLRDARLNLGQSKDILALLLNCTTEDFDRYENGESPPDEVLRRMSLVFNWNYLDLTDAVRSQQAYAFQPRMPAPAFAGATALLGRLNQVVGEIGTLFTRLPQPDQHATLAQLELVRDTMRRHQVRPAEPLAGRPSA